MPRAQPISGGSRRTLYQPDHGEPLVILEAADLGDLAELLKRSGSEADDEGRWV